VDSDRPLREQCAEQGGQPGTRAAAGQQRGGGADQAALHCGGQRLVERKAQHRGQRGQPAILGSLGIEPGGEPGDPAVDAVGGRLQHSDQPAQGAVGVAAAAIDGGQMVHQGLGAVMDDEALDRRGPRRVVAA
jgi:hypothetical protein